MYIGDVVSGVEMPEKGVRVFAPKYPFAQLTKGQAFTVQPQPQDGLDLPTLKKRLSLSAQAYMRKLGKNDSDERLKEIVVWINEDEAQVYVGCREDRTEEGVKAQKAAEKAAKKAAKGE
jgi:hypothetical protein